MKVTLVTNLSLFLLACCTLNPQTTEESQTDNDTTMTALLNQLDAGAGNLENNSSNTPPTPDSGTPNDNAAETNEEDSNEENPTPALNSPFAAGTFSWEPIEANVALNSATTSLPDNIDLTIYRPVSEDLLPVLLLSPGFMLSPTDFASYGEHFASWGYVTIVLALPGNMLNPVSHSTLSHILISLMDWIENQEDNSILNERADPTRVGLIGHSMGGKISLLTAANDDRVKAVFGIDPVDAAGGAPGSQPSSDYPSVTPERMPDIRVPIALVGETNNSQGGLFTPACAPADNNFEQYYLHAVGPAIKIDVLTASHMSFLDNPNCVTCLACPAGTDDPTQTKNLTQGYAISFFESTLNANEEMKTQWLNEDLPQNSNEGLISWTRKNNF